MELLYLDFDGVLHHDAVYRHPRRGIHVSQAAAPGRTLFEWAGHLEAALEPFADVKIVLSTSWVRTLGYSRTVKRLPPRLRERVVGATYHSEYTDPNRALGLHAEWQMLRGTEVLADVSRRNPSAWVAVDDTDEGWPDSERDRVVLCNSETGLGDPATRAKLDAILAWAFTRP